MPQASPEVSWRRDKEENGWRFAERLVELRGEDMQGFLANHRSELETRVRSDVLQATDETLPEIYGITPMGIPSPVTVVRKAQSKQLSAYLLFFEQFLLLLDPPFQVLT